MVPKAGFTLIELLVVVLIIGILAAMAWPQYLKAVERSRMAEAVNMINILVQAQQRKYMQTNRYASSLRGLDIALKNVSGNSFYTKGNAVSGTSENGFYIVLGSPAFLLTVFPQGKICSINIIYIGITPKDTLYVTP